MLKESSPASAHLIKSMKIWYTVSLCLQSAWFDILRKLHTAISDAEVHGIRKYLLRYVGVYLFLLFVSWYDNKRKGEAGNKYWIYAAVVDVILNVLFIWYIRSIHKLVHDITDHDKNWKPPALN